MERTKAICDDESRNEHPTDIQKITEQLHRFKIAHVRTETGAIVTAGMVFCSNDAGEIVAVYDRNTDELVTEGIA